MFDIIINFISPMKEQQENKIYSGYLPIFTVYPYISIVIWFASQTQTLIVGYER